LEAKLSDRSKVLSFSFEAIEKLDAKLSEIKQKIRFVFFAKSSETDPV
jgi:hypothetical protein